MTMFDSLCMFVGGFVIICVGLILVFAIVAQIIEDLSCKHEWQILEWNYDCTELRLRCKHCKKYKYMRADKESVEKFVCKEYHTRTK